ncbi:sulfotransferase [Aestuariivirga sp.]|uniref:sulfotransferase n=1 Tax=Aestuariivirga sp. TaxID=2650926 RepID=UPI003593CA11
MQQDFEFLFVTGCARAGTSVMANLLRTDSRIAMGRERFAELYLTEKTFPPELFEKERFCRILGPGDSHHRRLEPYYAELHDRYDHCVFRGDKIPEMAGDYGLLLENFERPRVIFMLRNIFDVADSFNGRAKKARASGRTDGWPWDRGSAAAVSEWNLALRNTLAIGERVHLHVVVYERLFEDSSEVEALLSFLKLAPQDSMLSAHRELMAEHRELDASRTNTLTSVEKLDIMRRADFAAYRQMLKLGNRLRKQSPTG